MPVVISGMPAWERGVVDSWEGVDHKLSGASRGDISSWPARSIMEKAGQGAGTENRRPEVQQGIKQAIFSIRRLRVCSATYESIFGRWTWKPNLAERPKL